MPPRIPAVLVFVVLYLAAVFGGGFDAPALRIDLWNADLAAALGLRAGRLGVLNDYPLLAERVLTGVLYLRLDEGLAFLAAALALPDAAWRPARTSVDQLVSLGVAGVTLAAMAIEPRYLTPAFGVLAALAVGDALASLGGRLNAATKG